MGQEEVYKLLEKKPRLCSKEIAELLHQSHPLVSRSIWIMVRRKEVLEAEPTEEEFMRIKDKFPTSITGKWCIKVFYVNEE